MELISFQIDEVPCWFWVPAEDDYFLPDSIKSDNSRAVVPNLSGLVDWWQRGGGDGGFALLCACPQLGSQWAGSQYWAMDWGMWTPALEHDDWRYDVVVVVIFSLLYV